MNIDDHSRRMSFEELRRRHAGHAESQIGDLFETDWEVFVARYDKNTGTYISRTFCCEAAVSASC